MFIWDTGASQDIVSAESMPEDQLFDLKSKVRLETANDTVKVSKLAKFRVEALGEDVEALAVPGSTPNLLSSGARCSMGYSFVWSPYNNPQPFITFPGNAAAVQAKILELRNDLICDGVQVRDLSVESNVPLEALQSPAAVREGVLTFP